MFDSSYSDKDLLAQVAVGDEVAFRFLFDRYRDRLFVYVYRFIKSEQVAEELVMDVFMKIWLGKELVLQIDNFNAFLYSIARNKCIDFFRSAARDNAFKELLWAELQTRPGELADGNLLLREYEDKLRKAISLLPSKRKKIYLLSREQDYSHHEIARQLNISRATVNNHIVEAQVFIRKYLVKNLELTVLFLLFEKIS
jgi:RNA polymerase sigma-70 factor (ECF subfamily)